MITAHRLPQKLDANEIPPPPTPSDDPHASARNMLASQPVLVIEDEGVIAWMIEDILSDLGFATIAIASSPDEALALAREQSFGLIVSDINLGAHGKDGVATVSEIIGGQSVPVIFVSGHADADALARMGGLANARLLRKPVTREDLVDALAAISRAGSIQ